jgi:hypothetical protein
MIYETVYIDAINIISNADVNITVFIATQATSSRASHWLRDSETFPGIARHICGWCMWCAAYMRRKVQFHSGIQITYTQCTSYGQLDVHTHLTYVQSHVRY